MTDRTDPYEIIGVRRDASLAEIRISYRRSTQILAPERFANTNDTVRAEAARRLSALNGAMEAIEAERAAESGSALGSLTFGGPAVSSAVEPTLRSVALAEEAPQLPPDTEATDEGVADVPADEAPAADEPPPAAADEPSDPHDDPIGLAEDVPDEDVDLPTGEQSWITDETGDTQDTQAGVPPTDTGDTGTGQIPVSADTEDGLPAGVGEDTAQEALPGEQSEALPAASLLQTPNPAPVAAPAPAAPRFERERPAKSAARTRSLLPRILGACALVAGIAAVAAYFIVGGGGSSSPKTGQFQAAGAPVSFSYPSGLVVRKPPSGGLLKPTFSTAVGLDAANYVVVATYRISASVAADGSAIGTGGSRLTADRFDQSVDQAAARIAAAQKLKAKGLATPSKAGDMMARVYDYTRPDGSTARYAFAFRGHTEYSIACFWNPSHAKVLGEACGQVVTSLQREAA